MRLKHYLPRKPDGTYALRDIPCGIGRDKANSFTAYTEAADVDCPDCLKSISENHENSGK